MTLRTALVKRHKVYGWTAVLLVWIAASLLGLWFYATPQFGAFDPKQQLQSWPEQSPLWQQLSLQQSQQLVLITEQDCSCSEQARQHVQQLATRYQVPTQQLSTEQAAQWQIPIPATPLLVWVQHGRLQYVGPPARGPNCSMDEDVLGPLLSGAMALPGSWRNSHEQSCRCLRTG